MVGALGGRVRDPGDQELFERDRSSEGGALMNWFFGGEGGSGDG